MRPGLGIPFATIENGEQEWDASKQFLMTGCHFFSAWGAPQWVGAPYIFPNRSSERREYTIISVCKRSLLPIKKEIEFVHPRRGHFFPSYQEIIFGPGH